MFLCFRCLSKLWDHKDCLLKVLYVALHIYIFKLGIKRKLIYAVRVKIVVALLGKNREMTERGKRETSEMLVIFVDPGAICTGEFSSQKFSRLCSYTHFPLWILYLDKNFWKHDNPFLLTYEFSPFTFCLLLMHFYFISTVCFQITLPFLCFGFLLLLFFSFSACFFIGWLFSFLFVRWIGSDAFNYNIRILCKVNFC